MAAYRLTLLRHGQAEPAGAGIIDRERPLTRRGIEEVAEIAQTLRAARRVPDLVLASPAARAATTARIVADVCEIDPRRIRIEACIYEATPQTLWRLVGAQGAQHHHLLICGHNPGLSELASAFGPQRHARDLPTAGLATGLWHGAGWIEFDPPDATRCEFAAPSRAGA